MPEGTLRVETADGRRLEIPFLRGDTVANAVWLSGLVGSGSLCLGFGRCRRCRVRFLSEPPAVGDDEAGMLGADAIAAGWRLACRHAAVDGMVLSVEAAFVPVAPGNRVRRREDRSLAVDLGTTTVCWVLLDGNGHPVAHGRAANPQAGAGADIMSRISAASTSDGRRRLRAVVLNLLRDILGRCGGAGSVVLAGNTAMTAIVADVPCDALAAAPYSLPLRGGMVLSIPDFPPTYVPPMIAPFVGGDVTAGLVGLDGGPYPYVLADMGTNGEFALRRDDGAAWVASVPLGPALEGMGMRDGVVAYRGAVTGFALSPKGLEPVFWHGLDDVEPLGMTATGYLSLVAHLLRVGAMTPEGRPAAVPLNPLAAALLRGLVPDPENGWSLPIVGTLRLTGSDVEELLKVRAAFVVALETLCAKAGLSAVPRVMLAGALGRHVMPDDLSALGFVPPGTEIVCVGNASLDGAVRLAADHASREVAERIARTCRLVDVTGDPSFMASFMRGMRFFF